ncbi:MAG: ABC transporter permease [Lachnospiraceae bacterium]|nr:ABC transporter permease [Lachnospiraceae bacterium]
MLGSIIGAVGQGLIWGIMVLGVYITYKVLNVSDLTVDGSFATGGCVFAVLVTNHIDPTLSLVLASLAGGACGFVTGVLHTRFKIPAILAGILTQLGLYSINLRILGDKANMSINKITTNITFMASLCKLTQSQAALIVGLIVVVLVVVFLYILFGTEVGASIRATGSNPQMMRSLGVNTDNVVLFGIMLSNMLIGLSGALLVEMNKYTDVSMGKGAIVYGLASIVIGEVCFKFFKNFGLKLSSAVMGCIIFFIIRSVVIRLGLKANDMQLLSSLIVAIALSMPIVRDHYQRKKEYKKMMSSILGG